MLELEMKISIADPDNVRRRLAEMGIAKSEIRLEKDVYFNAPDRDFAATDEALRIRRAGNECTLTYKGPKMRMHALKAREEFTVRVDSFEEIERILERLGMRRVMEVRKRREIYRTENITVTLDEVEGLGSYVEIETLVEKGSECKAELLEVVKKQLGIDGEPTTLSYLEILLAKRSEVRP